MRPLVAVTAVLAVAALVATTPMLVQLAGEIAAEGAVSRVWAALLTRLPGESLYILLILPIIFAIIGIWGRTRR